MTKYEIHLQFDHCLISCYSIFFLSLIIISGENGDSNSDHDVLGGHIYNLPAADTIKWVRPRALSQ